MVNKVTLIGHLGKDPDIRTLENGSKVGSFSLATNENYKDKNDTWQSVTEWHNIVVWRNLAEKAEREFKKGTLAYIEGKISHRKYQDKDGIEKSITDIVASNVYSLEKREKQSGFDTPFPTAADDPFSQKPATSSAPPQNNSHTPEADDDLPF